MAQFDVNEEHDLPLMANVDDVRVLHYVMRLKLMASDSLFHGEVILKLKHLKKLDHFQCILDARDLDVDEAAEVVVGDDCAGDLFENERKPLSFETDAWSITVRKPGINKEDDYPTMLYLNYKTRPEGKSLMWRQTQDGDDCVFTPASHINNRSLFPCQEPPIAMATWECAIILKDDQFPSVLCTGDEDGIKRLGPDGWAHHHFRTKMVLPMSTFALAIGNWKELEIVSKDESKISSGSEGSCEAIHEPYPCHVQRGDSGPLIPCRLFAPSSLMSVVTCLWPSYIRACLEASYNLLGSHPFGKLDVLILPRCYSGLGLASPNLMFVSQSLAVKTGEGHGLSAMLLRFGHEVSHSWFGLVIGALDWTEEWLSEGFATFAEDYIHTETLEILRRQGRLERFGYDHNTDLDQLASLRSYQRYQTLKAEVSSTEEDLQILRPMEGHQLKDLQKNVSYVKNGLNPEIALTQVHYIKGYFLLRHLLAKVGEQGFFKLLRRYIHDLYHGQLVHSTEFLTLFFQFFPEVFDPDSCQENVSRICSVWLDTNGIPEELHDQFKGFLKEDGAEMTSDLISSVKWWKRFERGTKRKADHRDHDLPEAVANLITEQLIILLEELLRLKSMTKRTLTILDEVYKFGTDQNVDVQHRWCELVIKHDFRSGFKDVEDFLTENQSMGVYLYGEMASGNKNQRKLCQKIFRKLEPEMDPLMVANVKSLLPDPE